MKGKMAGLAARVQAHLGPPPLNPLNQYTVFWVECTGDNGQVWGFWRRYRDFVNLRQELLRTPFCVPHGGKLPEAWQEMEQLRKSSQAMFGKLHPEVVEQRRRIVERCLSSALAAVPPLPTARPLLEFLAPPPPPSDDACRHRRSGSNSSDSSMDTQASWGLLSGSIGDGHGAGGMSALEVGSAFGSTVHLLVDLPTAANPEDLMDAQGGHCVCCRAALPREPAPGSTRRNTLKDLFNRPRALVGEMRSRAGSMGGQGTSARRCQYTGEMYCTACHTNEQTPIPAAMLQDWDFKPRKVCSMAKAYLDSIKGHPVLCVSAVNPNLYNRVPILNNVRDLRVKLMRHAKILQQCSSGERLLAGLGSHRYIVDNTEFYSMCDLLDLSKVSTVSKEEHPGTAIFLDTISACTRTCMAQLAMQWCMLLLYYSN
ncbi:hypothetical protein CYMTET_20237 [Cymbomonas tetramitiformis]|uniref:PX domain-containing protein n=1 Tax=Cymbomonas tetramitiformis TaxID=36881 RepID=A0AAE0L4D3_9CHLO|nr:hypothetical protein CYMTET_20237 [Cymbomonas tetramitiformis]